MTRRKPSTSGSGTFTVGTDARGVRLALDACEAQVGSRYVSLSDLECRLLRVLIEENGQVATRTELMVAGWASASPDRVALLDETIERLRARLGTGVTIESVPGIGYRLR